MPRKRNAGRRSIRPVMRIFTEGARTEVNYVKGYINSYLKSRGYIGHDIIVEQPTDFSPPGLLKEALRERLVMDEAWIVFDCDQHSFKAETFRDASKNQVGVAYSSICFETWILLHFTYSTRAYQNCDELITSLDKFFPCGYDKAMNNLFAETTGPGQKRLHTAIANARRLNREIAKVNQEKHTYELNPYTNIHELLKAIDDFIGRKMTH